MGDSHAASLHSGLVEAMPYANVMQATASSCRPLLASRTVDKAYCASLMSDVFDRFLPEQLPDVVVIASYWGRSDLANVPPTLKWFAAHGIPVVVIGPMTIYDMPLPGLLALAASRHDDNLVESRRVPGREALDTWLRAAADRDGAGFVSMIETLCHERCTTRTSDDTPLLFDVSHLTPEGARLVAPAIVAVVEARLARTPASKPDVASEGESGANQAAPNDRGRGATPG